MNRSSLVTMYLLISVGRFRSVPDLRCTAQQSTLHYTYNGLRYFKCAYHRDIRVE